MGWQVWQCGQASLGVPDLAVHWLASRASAQRLRRQRDEEGCLEGAKLWDRRSRPTSDRRAERPPRSPAGASSSRRTVP